MRRPAQDSKNIELNFGNYLNGYSRNVREIIENFQLEKILTKLSKNDLLYQLVEKFAEVDLSPNNVTNHDIGNILEELLRRFSKMSNHTAGEHYTPREVIRLMLSEDDKVDMQNILTKLHADESLNAVPNANNPRDAKVYKFNQVLDRLLLEFVHTKLDLYKKLTGPKVNEMLKRQ